MKRRLALALVCLPVIASAAFGQSVNPLPAMQAITFPPGSGTSTVTGQLAPGGRNVYYVLAKAGQTLSVTVASGPRGTTFQVFRPDATLARGSDGLPVVTGRTLPDAGPSDSAMAWIGAIPVDGNYLVLVGRAEGSGELAQPYSLAVSLK